MLNTGDKAPDFTLPDQDGRAHRLSEHVRHGPVLVYFYPADFTPGCTREACSIRDSHEDIATAGLTILGISPQDSESHARFRDRHNLPFPLLADPDKKVVNLFGVDGPMGVMVRRATFLIGADMTVLDRVIADLRISKHMDFIREAIDRQAQSA